MYSIPANLVAVSANLVRSLATAIVRHASCLNKIQNRTLSKLIGLPFQALPLNYQSQRSLLREIRPFSSQALEIRSNPPSIQEIAIALFKPPTSGIEESQENKIKKIDYWTEAVEETHKGNFEKAEEYYTLAIQKEEKEEDIEGALLMKAFRGDFYREIGQFDKAIKDLREAIAEAPRPRMASFRDLAYTYRDKGEASKAIEVLQEGLKAIPTSSSLRYELGEIFLKMNNTKLALVHLEEVVKDLDNDSWLPLNENLYEFLPDLKEIVFQLNNCAAEEAPAIYEKLLEARERLSYHPFSW